MHPLFTLKSPVSGETILQAENAIAKYIFYSQCFPNCIIPKQYILEKHSIYFMLRTRLRPGFLGEQGGEQLHLTVSCLARSAALRNDKNRMKIIMEKALLFTAPELNALVPHIQNRQQKWLIIYSTKHMPNYNMKLMFLSPLKSCCLTNV